MSSTTPQSVLSGCRKYVKSRIKFNTFNTFNNVGHIDKDIIGKKDSGKIAGDHRLLAAIRLTKKWEKRKLQNRIKKLLKSNPFKPKELAHSVLQLKRFGVVSDNENGEGCAFESVIEE